ncbi:MAG TPA: DUF3592 domain-containing protein [Actinophytocola sp.]|uniref:DUF3592 domain-containing protein n=1 Tax=Actinophytocola sp. TaxID=1872138 RepID=UPI002DBE551C|nr:DUF3592 domain-containing protein [Actinophytocola sp.]HEU5472940.1 DUF3592 domain-containing protein [Actinophytocola sp.]
MRRSGSSRPSPVLFAALGAVVISVLVVATWQVWSNDNALSERGQQASGRVVKVTTGKNSRVHVEFRTADGRQVRSTIGQGDEAPGPRAKAGDLVAIIYDPLHPEDDLRDARAPENHKVASLLLGATVLAVVAIPAATWAGIRARRRERSATPADQH